MTTKRKRVTAEVTLNYRVGRDDPNRGIYRNSVVPPKYAGELIMAVRSQKALRSQLPYNAATDGPPQIHLVGTARALEELGRYLIALARLETADPEPYGWFDNVRYADGGRARFLPRRISRQLLARSNGSK